MLIKDKVIVITRTLKNLSLFPKSMPKWRKDSKMLTWQVFKPLATQIQPGVVLLGTKKKRIEKEVWMECNSIRIKGRIGTESTLRANISRTTISLHRWTEETLLVSTSIKIMVSLLQFQEVVLRYLKYHQEATQKIICLKRWMLLILSSRTNIWIEKKWNTKKLLTDKAPKNIFKATLWTQRPNSLVEVNLCNFRTIILKMWL